MVDLGAYTTEVLLAYAGALGGLIVLVVASIWKGRKVARRLDEVEARRKGATPKTVPEAAE